LIEDGESDTDEEDGSLNLQSSKISFQIFFQDYPDIFNDKNIKIGELSEDE
jgi:hypothetical protein